jgi:hypothetical protein
VADHLGSLAVRLGDMLGSAPDTPEGIEGIEGTGHP